MKPKLRVSGSKILHNPHKTNWRWELRDYDGYLIDSAKTPAEIRLAKRRWFLFLTISDSDRAWSILEGRIDIK